MKDLGNLLQVLLENKIDFVLIGGFAGVVHGSTQVTRDLDVCAAVGPQMIEALRKALSGLHAKHRMNPNFKPTLEDEPRILDGVKNLYLETDLGVLDVISEVTGVGDFERLKSQAVEIPLFGHTCKVISIEDLIACKTQLGREKDRLVAKELKAILLLQTAKN